MQPVVQEGHTNMQLMQNQNSITSENVSSPYHNQGNLDPRMNHMSGARDQMSGGGGISGAGVKNNMNVLGANVGSVGGFTSGVEGHMSGAGREYMNGPGHHVGRIGEQGSGVGGHMAGMGPNIVNMMMSGHKPNANEKPVEEGGILTQPMIIDAPQSPHGQIGVTPIPAQMGTHQSSDRPLQALNQQQYENNQGNFNKPNLNSSNMSNAGKPLQQITPNHCAHGQHAHGIAKFNEMFPGVMTGFGGDLNFDPMALAVQMNPANQQRTAIDTIQKLMCEGMLNVSQQRAGRNAPNQQVVVEKVGGDTLPENEAENEAAKRQVVSDHIGDVDNVDKVQNNGMREQSIPIRNSKARNGLQDIVYTSYPASAAWSFHGHARPSYSVGPRNRTRF
ncbi:unnamed protein product, partial [Iphiclides podalirius]